MIDLISFDPCLFQDIFNIVQRTIYCHFKNILSFHYQCAVFFYFFFFDKRCILQFTDLVQGVGITESGKFERNKTLSFAKDYSSGSIPEKDASVAFGPIHHAGGFFGANNQNMFHVAPFKQGVSHIQCVNETGAGSIKVDTRAIGSQHTLKNTAQRRSHVFIECVGANDII